MKYLRMGRKRRWKLWENTSFLIKYGIILGISTWSFSISFQRPKCYTNCENRKRGEGDAAIF